MFSHLSIYFGSYNVIITDDNQLPQLKRSFNNKPGLYTTGILKPGAETLEGAFFKSPQQMLSIFSLKEAAWCSGLLQRASGKQTCPTGHVAIPICLGFDLPTRSPPPLLWLQGYKKWDGEAANLRCHLLMNRNVSRGIMCTYGVERSLLSGM